MNLWEEAFKLSSLQHSEGYDLRIVEENCQFFLTLFKDKEILCKEVRDLEGSHREVLETLRLDPDRKAEADRKAVLEISNEAYAKKWEAVKSQLPKLANQYPKEFRLWVLCVDYRESNWCDHPSFEPLWTLFPEEVKELLSFNEGSAVYIVGKELDLVDEYGVKDELKLKGE